MKAGLLSTRIRIESRTAGATDDWGQPLPESWDTVAELWANVKHLNGVESIKASATVSTVKASVRIRYRADIDAGMRVLIGAAVYDIRAVLPDMQRREYLDLVVEATA